MKEPKIDPLKSPRSLRIQQQREDVRHALISGLIAGAAVGAAVTILIGAAL